LSATPSSTPQRLRIIDSGRHDARTHIAFDQALIDAHQCGAIGDTVRFLEFEPSVLVGRHQVVAAEIDLEYCAAHSITVARRITGGGALYMDPDQLGWELVCARARMNVGGLADVTAHICTAVARELSRLGLPIAFRPRNDLEIDGRKIGGTGGFFDRDTLFFQGTLLRRHRAEIMFAALRVAPGKRARHALGDARARVTSLDEACGGGAPPLAELKVAIGAALSRLLASEATAALIDAREWERVAHCRRHIGSDAFIFGDAEHLLARCPAHARIETPGGTIEVDLDVRGATVESARFSGDFFVTPVRVLFDLEAHLRGCAVTALADTARDFLTRARVDALSIDPAHFVDVLVQAGAHARRLTGAGT
jgi:lipoate-protein ligase A